eukprot:c10416_g1_i1.p2 GENE.c10416_g1_i1~~c10416_g1_i1.p2  ORF type:complete len:115 (+),score=21.29 c10416_g1_i1:411-755(+)
MMLIFLLLLPFCWLLPLMILIALPLIFPIALIVAFGVVVRMILTASFEGSTSILAQIGFAATNLYGQTIQGLVVIFNLIVRGVPWMWQSGCEAYISVVERACLLLTRLATTRQG